MMNRRFDGRRKQTMQIMNFLAYNVPMASIMSPLGVGICHYGPEPLKLGNLSADNLKPKKKEYNALAFLNRVVRQKFFFYQ